MRGIALAGILLVSACGDAQPSRVPASASSARQVPTPLQSSPAPSPVAEKPGLMVVVLEPPGSPQQVVNFIALNGSSNRQVKLAATDRVLAARGRRVFVADQAGSVRAITPDGAVTDLHLSVPGCCFLPSPDGERWLWSVTDANVGPNSVSHSRAYLSTSGAPRLVAERAEVGRALQPLSWTTSGVTIVEGAMGIGGYFPLGFLQSGPVHEVDLERGSVTAIKLKADCQFADISIAGTLACVHRDSPELGAPTSIKLVAANGTVQTIPLPSDRFRLVGLISFDPTGKKLVIGGSPVVGPSGERFETDVINTETGQIARLAAADIRPALPFDSWLPGGDLLVTRPSYAQAADRGIFVLSPSGSLRKLTDLDQAVGVILD